MSKIKFLFCFIFTVCYAATNVLAQTRIAGRVVDARTQKGIEAVIVSSPSAITKSHKDGSFELIIQAYDSIQFSKEGYFSKTFFSTDNLSLIFLEENSKDLEEVVLTGTLRPSYKSESPVPVEVFTSHFFKKNPTPSLFESMQNINGVRPQINCSVCNTGDIHINGLEGPYTLVTIDGMPIVSSLSSVYGLFGIPSQLIERVEVVKGPASSLYGSEAIGGLINVITKNPQQAPKFSGQVMATNWGEYTVDLGTQLKISQRVNSLIGLNYFNYQNPTDKNDDNFTDITLQHRISLFTKWNLQRKNNRTFQVAARIFYEDRWGGEMNWARKYRGGNEVYGESIYTNRYELLGNYQLPIDTEKWLLSYSLTSHKQNSVYGETSFQAQQNIAFTQLTWQKEWKEKHASLIGLATKYQFYDDNSIATQNPFTQKNKPDESFIPGIFLQDEWSLSDNHLLLTGFRYEFHPTHKSIFTPRIAWKMNGPTNNILRLNIGTGFRVVNLFTEEHAALSGAKEIVLEEALKPEKSYNANLNYTQTLRTTNSKITWDASVWYTYFTNRILPDYETNLQQIIYRNLNGYAVSKGISLNIDGSFNNWKYTIGSTLQEIHQIVKQGTRKIKEQPMLTEKWSGTWSISYKLPRIGFTIDYTGNIYGKMKLPLTSAWDPRQPYSPVWSLQNLQFTKQVNTNWELMLGVKNLLNWTPAKNNPFIIARAQDPFDKNVEWDAAGNPKQTAENPYGLSFDPTYIYVPNQGIRFFIGARFQFL